MECLGWRETAGCDPHGPAVATALGSCDAAAADGREHAGSGVCECSVSGAAGSAVRVARAGGAGGGPFTCRDACKQPPQCRGFTLMDQRAPVAARGGGVGFLREQGKSCLRSS